MKKFTEGKHYFALIFIMSLVVHLYGDDWLLGQGWVPSVDGKTAVRKIKQSCNE
jgi:hypothetical protein